MKSILHFAIAGVIAAAMMVLLKLLLSQQAVLLATYHYPPFDLAGQEGLRRLARFAVFGAAYAVAFGLVLKVLLPGGLILGSLALGCVPTLVSALVLPLYRGLPALKEPWTLLWLFAHWTFYALCLLFITGGKASKGSKRDPED
jgi:hypothetical protein